MKITFVTSTLTAGGAERVISLLADKFSDKGNDVEVIALTSISPDFYTVGPNVKFIHADKVCGGGMIKELLWFRKHIKDNRPDVVIAFMEAVYEFVLMALLGTEMPVISSERKDPTTLGPIRKLLRWILLPTVKAHVVQTEKIKEFYNSIVRKKTHIIYNPVNDRVFDVRAKEYNGNDGLGMRLDRIVSVGRLYPQKNQAMLIDAFYKIKDKYPSCKLVIYGEGFLRDKLQRHIDELDLSQRVLLPGTSDDVIAEVRRSKVFCLSSDYEGMSNAMIEAMCVGTPVVSTKVSGTDELIHDGENGMLVDVKDVNGLAMALDKLLADEDLRKKFSDNGLAMADMFKTDTIVEKWDALIMQVIKK